MTPTPFGALVAQQRRSAVAAAETVTQSEVTPGLRRGLEVSDRSGEGGTGVRCEGRWGGGTAFWVGCW